MISKFIAVVAVFALVSLNCHAAGPLWSLKHSIKAYHKVTKSHDKEFKKIEKAFKRAKRWNSNETILRYFTKRIKSSSDMKLYKETMNTIKDDFYNAENSVLYIMDTIRKLPKNKHALINALTASSLVIVLGFPR
jgi:uncharacterized protein (DUF2132 family)